MWNRQNNPCPWLSWLGLCLALALSTAQGHQEAGLIPVTATFEPNTDNGEPIEAPDESKPDQKGKWVTVGGFADSTYFYGRLQLLGKRKVAGFLYHSGKGQVYVYGEIIRPGEFRAFDKKGTTYRLLLVDKKY